MLAQAAAGKFLQAGDWLSAFPQDINQTDDKGRTVLHHAAAAEDGGQDVEDIVHLLLDAGADVHQPDAAGDTPFNIAAANAPVCGRLMTGHWLSAALDGRGAKGLNDTSGSHGSTLAQYMAKWTADDEIEEQLKQAVAAGMKPDVQNKSGWTPLMAACAMGRDAAVEAFLWHYRFNDVFLETREDYAAVYHGRRVTYAAGLSAPELAFTRLRQDKAAPPELAAGLCRCIALVFLKD
jgi:ankyrin repeat protein